MVWKIFLYPAFLDGSHLRKFDIVLANPPYSIKEWSREKFMNDKWGRNFLGTPPQGRADYAFFQHILASMNDQNGRCAILFPHGVLFRDEEFELRKKLVEMDIVDCVIGLGPNLFFNASMEACIIVCKKNKPLSHKKKVLFIDAKEEVTRKNAESYLEGNHILRILDGYRNYCQIDYFSEVISNEDILNNKSLLSIQSYVKQKCTNEIYTLDESIADLDKSSKAMHIEFNNLLRMMTNE
jgi:type I restriction enzyme M protein